MSEETKWFACENCRKSYTTHMGHECDLEDVVSNVEDLRERLAAAERENAALRQGLSNVATNIGNGAAAAPNCTLEFLAECVPNEVKLVCADLRQRLTRAEADGAAMRLALLRLVELKSTKDLSDPGYTKAAKEDAWEAARAALASDHPGADLLAIVDAARKVTICHGAGVVGVEYEGFSATEIEDAYAHLGALSVALATYDARVQANKQESA